MKRLFFCFLAFLAALPLASVHARPNEASRAVVVADYSNIVTSMPEDPHQSGYAVVIYRRNDGFLFGDFTFASGSTEANGGKLLDLRFDGRNLSFKAKTSAFGGGSRPGPSRELFEFHGEVRGAALIGQLTRWDGYDLSNPVKVMNVRLRREKTATPLTFEEHQEIFAKDAW